YDSPLIVVIYLIGLHHPDPRMAELMMSSALLQFRTRKDLPATALLSIPLLVVFCLYHSSVLFATPMALGWASPFAPTIQNSEMLPSALTTAFRCTCAWHPAHSVIKFCSSSPPDRLRSLRWWTC